MSKGDFYFYLSLSVFLGVYALMGFLMHSQHKTAGAGTQRAEYPPNQPAEAANVEPDKSLAAICRLEKTNDPDALIKMFVARYEAIVAAYAEGTLDAQAGLLAKDVRATFVAAIIERDQAAYPLKVKLLGARAASLVNASITDGIASVSIAISGLVETTISGEGRVSEAGDTWTFERQIKRDKLGWVLVGTSPMIEPEPAAQTLETGM